MDNSNNNMPVYLQITERIAAQIYSGKLEPGTQIPSVREVALLEKVNPNTVQRALAELEADGLIINKRTNGKFVTDDKELISEKREEYATELTRAYENKMTELGAKIRMPKILWIDDDLMEPVDDVEQVDARKEGRGRRWFF